MRTKNLDEELKRILPYIVDWRMANHSEESKALAVKAFKTGLSLGKKNKDIDIKGVIARFDRFTKG